MSKINRLPVRRTAAGVLAGALALSGAVAVATPANALPAFGLDRIAGDNRYETSARIAEAFGPTSGAILASGEAGRSVDALSANFLAGVREVPVLLTQRDRVPASVMARLNALTGAKNVTIVGGTVAVSAAVETRLRGMGFTVTRLGGDDRYETSEQIITAGRASASTIGLVASGLSFPDALAGAPLSYKGKHPVFLTSGASIPQDTIDAMVAAGTRQVIILGGTAAVPASVEAALVARGISVVTRLGGAGRSETSRIVADYLINSQGFTNTTFNVASGAPRGEGADALSGGALSGKQNRALLITSTQTQAAPVIEFARDRAATLNAVGNIFGGPAAVSLELEAAIEEAGRRGAGPVALTAATVAQGGALTGTITGDFSSVTVSGCGFTNQALPADTDTATAGRQFTLNVSGGQAVGNCTLTFTATPTGGGAAVTQTIQVNVTQGAVSATVRPELVSAQIVSTSSANQATPGTVIRYVFDEAVGAINDQDDFNVYRFADSNTAIESNSARIDPDNPNAVLARFNAIVGTAPNAAAPLTTTADLTLATVELGAAVDRQGLSNPIGSAALGTGLQGSATSVAGRTAGPDLVSLNFRAATTGRTAVDFVFDQVAYVQNATAGNFRIVLPNGDAIECDAPANNATNAGATQGGGVTVGGNGTTTITVLCNNIDSAGGTVAGTTLSATNVARGVVTAGAVGTTPAAGVTVFTGVSGVAVGGTNAEGTSNVGNVITASDAPDNGTVAPDLVSVTLQQRSGQDDVVLFNFDQAVSVLNTAGDLFRVYTSGGGSVAGNASGENVTANGSQVAVFFDENTVRGLTGGNVADAAVEGQGGQDNRADEAATTNLQQGSTTAQPAGRTTGPDLTAVTLSQGGVFGNRFGATYTFDERINQTGATIRSESLNLVLADGSRLQCDAGTATFVRASTSGAGEGDNQVRCTDFDVVEGPATLGDATSAQIGSATLGTAEEDAVTDSAGNDNPQGAAMTTGGTGTRAS